MAAAGLIDRLSGRALDADAHIGRYGPGERHYDDEGDYGYVYREGLLSEHVPSFKAVGGVIRVASTGSGLRYAVLSDGRAVPVVCSDLIPITTEDGYSDGRCGANATEDGMCPGHAAEYRSYMSSLRFDR